MVLRGRIELPFAGYQPTALTSVLTERVCRSLPTVSHFMVWQPFSDVLVDIGTA